MAEASRVRYDIEGLRGFAIALVVVFHVWVGRVSSGVDVFLLIGGIFFFGSQLRNARNPKGLTFLQSLVRMLRRLYPLLVVVVASALMASLLIMSRLVHTQMAGDARASLMYVINWRLAYSGRDYNSVSTSISPFQHLWSMSAQMQIYAGSLLVVTIIAFIFRRHSHGALIAVLSAATILSFIYATWMHGQDQSVNYYSTLSRFWEVGMGGLIGMLLLRKDPQGNPAVRIDSSAARWVLGVVGILMIACTGLFLDGASQFPGPLTLIPLVGATLVILAGSTGKPVGVTRFLETRPMKEIGSISYALYLWHWPLLVIALVYSGEKQVSFALGSAVIATSLVLAWFSKKLIEDPLRQRSKPRRSWIVFSPSYWRASLRVWPKAVAAVAVLGVAAGVGFAPRLVHANSAMDDADLWAAMSNTDLYPGANAFFHDQPTPPGIRLGPPLVEFDALLPATQKDGCQIGFDPDYLVLTKNFNRSQEECAYGDINSPRTMYIVGGSHSEQYLPALDTIGKRTGIKMIPLLKMGCPVNARITRLNGDPYPSCERWSERVMRHIESFPPTEGIFMVGTRPTGTNGTGPERVPEEYVDTVKQFTDWGLRTYLVRDNPWHTATAAENEKRSRMFDMRECVVNMIDGNWDRTEDGKNFPGAAIPETPTQEEIADINAECGTPAADSLLPEDPSIKAYDGLDVVHMDMTAGLCRDGWCPAIIGNVVAYRDMHHFTNAFAATLADELQAQMFDPDHKKPSLSSALSTAHRWPTPVLEPQASTQGGDTDDADAKGSGDGGQQAGDDAAANAAAGEVGIGDAPSAARDPKEYRDEAKIRVTTPLDEMDKNYWSYLEHVVRVDGTS